MKWYQSDKVVIKFILIVTVLLYALYKGLKFLAGASMGASFGGGLGGMSGSQQTEESRKVETDAPVQVIYRIDDNRFLTLENYIACDKGGQVYYNDIRQGIKTMLGRDYEFYDFSYRRGNSVAAYQGIIINGANNGYLVFPGAETKQYCGSGNSTRGCSVFFYFSSDYGKSFTWYEVANEYNTPKRFSKLKVMVVDSGIYLRDESEEENIYSRPTGSNDLYSVNKLRFSDGKLINIYEDWQNEVDKLVKKELIRKKLPYANEYGPNFNIFDYIRRVAPEKTHDERNSMANELSKIKIKIKIKDKVYSNRIKFPIPLNQGVDANYQCDKNIGAESITYLLESTGKKEVVKNGQ